MSKNRSTYNHQPVFDVVTVMILLITP